MSICDCNCQERFVAMSIHKYYLTWISSHDHSHPELIVFIVKKKWMKKTSYNKTQIRFFLLLCLNYVFITIVGVFSVSRLIWVIEKVRTLIIHVLLCLFTKADVMQGLRKQCYTKEIICKCKYSYFNSYLYVFYFCALLVYRDTHG